MVAQVVKSHVCISQQIARTLDEADMPRLMSSEAVLTVCSV